MMLKSDSFRLAKKAASASYLGFFMRKNGNFLEVQTWVLRNTVPEWHERGTAFTCLNAILSLTVCFYSHSSFCWSQSQHCSDAQVFQVRKANVPSACLQRERLALQFSSSYPANATFWHVRLIFLCMHFFGASKYIWKIKSLIGVSLIHRLAAVSINVYWEWQDH